MIDDWQDLVENLDGDEVFVSAGSGTKYSGDEIEQRVQQEIDMMKEEGVYPSDMPGGRPVPRVEDREGNHWMRDLVDQEWYDLTTGDEEYFADRVFQDHKTVHQNDLPHQGWKLRVSADPEEARDVAETVLPYLQDEGVAHKVVEDAEKLSGMSDGQEGKFITIYPEVDDYKKDNIMQHGRQQFRAGAENFNTASIHANLENASEVVSDLEGLLRASDVELNGGPSLDGHNGEEKQYGDSRIHFRYGSFGPDAEVVQETGGSYTVSSNGLIGKEGDVVGGSYEGDEIEGLQQPI
ncbi:hypothetical protein GKQ38_01985 [Candidatus Nanohaloarchaea archaeon]|nr:hypothetical protein GKQ38_01985 [Candidatus Nanohaloarchaea archaeon]